MQFFKAAGQRIHDCNEWVRLAPPAAASDAVMVRGDGGRLSTERAVNVGKLRTGSRTPA